MNKRSKNSKKCTHMSAATLRTIRQQIGFDMRSLAISLGLPYRTYQDYEYDNRGIPKEVADAVRDFRRRDRQTTNQIIRRIGADIDRQYPGGIPSESSND